jgi:hypothetical protein
MFCVPGEKVLKTPANVRKSLEAIMALKFTNYPDYPCDDAA